MDIKVVVAESTPCSDLASLLAMIYDLLLRRAEKARTERDIDEQAGTQREIDEKASEKPAP